MTTSNPYMDSLLAARAADEGEKTGPQPVAWRWKHQRDERWTYGQQPKHLVPPRGKELIGYYIVEPLFAEPPTPEWTLEFVDDPAVILWKAMLLAGAPDDKLIVKALHDAGYAIAKATQNKANE